MPIKTAHKFKKTATGEIPIDWEVVKGSMVFTTIKGKTPSELYIQPKPGYLPYISNEYLRNNTPLYAKPTPETTLTKKNDIILLWDGSNAGEIFLAKAGILSSTTSLLEIKDETRFAPKYIYYALKAKEVELQRTTKGTGVPHVDGQLLSAFSFAIPSIKEQGRIAKVLSSIDEAIDKTQQAIQQTQVVKKGLMQELFARRLPGKHKRMHIRDLLVFCQYGLNKPLTGDSTGVAVLRMNNLVGGKVDTQALKYTALTSGEEKEFLLTDGDILFNRTNSRELVGKVSIFNGKGKLAFASYLLRLRVDPQKVNPSWLNFYLNSPLLQNTFRTLATPGVSQSNINAQAMQAIKLNVPDLKAQGISARLLESLEDRIKAETDKKAFLEQTKLSLMQVLLTGKVRVAI